MPSRPLHFGYQNQKKGFSMLKRFLFGVAAFSLAAVAAATPSEELSAAIASAKSGSKVPAVGAVILRDGAVSAQTVLGVREAGSKAAVTLDDVWLIGSTGKVMTVAMIARLVERGVLAWDTPLDAMLPDMAGSMRPEYRKVTLVELLSHRAGFPRDLRNDKTMVKFFRDGRPSAEQRLSYVAVALKDKPEAKAGTFSYSNAGFIVATVIAERAAHASYEELMGAEVFKPLGMTRAGFGNTGEGQNRGHQHGKPMRHMARLNDGAPRMYAPAGFLHMSLEDWAKFNLDQLAGAAGKGKLLSPASYRLMQTAQPGSPAGLDWGVQQSIAGRQGPVLVHQGSDGNWLAIAVLFPEQGTGALMVANAGPDMGADQVLMGLAGSLFAQLSPAKPK
ncbi:beta-lactamase family protein [Massilia sp. Dwa41.01b]|uniref:serine hydrolase domain-containing protein n=1 Tax=unclassified Massilia TaxID=2609279 RepID=UPI0016031B84|nr:MULTISPECIES: serine hydrolase domain-containing protein [unclassified Massilia]QNA88028.1 beta-lactamase family protein [Massilia sp. Dwa41.01b]QNA98930.1 beta-lactamase family protein [Massilia sp. Se16.2.3]